MNIKKTKSINECGFDKIVVTGDLWRCNDNGSFTQNGNILAIHQLVKSGLRGFVTTTDLLQGNESISKAPYGHRNLEPNWAGWANLFYSKPETRDIEAVHFLDQYDLLVGFEISPFFIQMLEKLQLPFVNICVAPIRFSEKRLFTLHSNVAEINQRLETLSVATNHLQKQAARITAKFLKQDQQQLLEDTLIITGQTATDRVLINRYGNFDKIDDYNTQLEKLAQDYKQVIYKPHPLATSGEPPLKGIKTYTGDFYQICAQPGVKGVVSISSSTSIEAKFFGCEGMHLEADRYHALMHGTLVSVDLDDSILWATIMGLAETGFYPETKFLEVSEIFR